jgi:hypothetical protein
MASVGSKHFADLATSSQHTPLLKKASASADKNCGICLQDVATQGKLPSCEHLFCFDCIHRWSAVVNTCPLCKRRFTTIDKVVQRRLSKKQIVETVDVPDRQQSSNVDGDDEEAVAAEFELGVESGGSTGSRLHGYSSDEGFIVDESDLGSEFSDGLASDEDEFCESGRSNSNQRGGSNKEHSGLDRTNRATGSASGGFMRFYNQWGEHVSTSNMGIYYASAEARNTSSDRRAVQPAQPRPRLRRRRARTSNSSLETSANMSPSITLTQVSPARNAEPISLQSPGLPSSSESSFDSPILVLPARQPHRRLKRVRRTSNEDDNDGQNVDDGGGNDGGGGGDGDDVVFLGTPSRENANFSAESTSTFHHDVDQITSSSFQEGDGNGVDRSARASTILDLSQFTHRQATAFSYNFPSGVFSKHSKPEHGQKHEVCSEDLCEKLKNGGAGGAEASLAPFPCDGASPSKQSTRVSSAFWPPPAEQQGSRLDLGRFAHRRS